ncbi:MAG: hypothetical protein KGY60_01120 [Bacteroidales bacterium]|nr:hypothetical protein [Bacteroidales bacterium]
MKYMQLNVSLIALLFFLSVGCTGIYEDGNELADGLRSEIHEIGVDSLKSMIDNGAEFLLLDVRQPDEKEAGNIPGSVSIPRGVLEFQIFDDSFWEEQFMYTPEKEDQIIVYCQSGVRGVLAAHTLKQLGFKNVANLKGGWIAFSGGEPAIEKEADSGGCGG